MEPKIEDSHEARQARLRADLLRLKTAARTLPLTEWVDKALGLIEREKMQELERYKLRQHEAGIAPRRVLGARVVETREQ